MTDVNSLRSVLKFLGTGANAYQDPDYEPVFLSSAMFPIICGDGLAVTLSFMNYWKHKNGIEQLSCLMTIRNQHGETIDRSYFKIEQDVYQFRFPELITSHLGPDRWFTGSVEFQIHSIEDQKFPYPAISIFYETPEGVSAVHMASRVFHNVSDMEKRLRPDNLETGFDLFSDDEVTPFICFTNGPKLVEQTEVAFKVFNSRGEEKELILQLGELNPYETKFVYPDRQYELNEFLRGRVGWCKIKYDSFGIFPRLICGNVHRDFSRIAITHSYYDESNRKEYFDFDPTADSRGPYRFFPLLLDEHVELDLNFYPIYSQGEILLSAKFYDSVGNLLLESGDLGSVDSPSNQIVTLNVGEVLRQAGIPFADSRLITVECSTTDGKVPSRINYGVNYHRPNQIGTNINISMHQEAEFTATSRSWRWLPIYMRPGLSNRVLISAVGSKLHDDFTAEVEMKLFGVQGQFHQESFSIKNQSGHQLNIEEILGRTEYKPEAGEVIWCTFVSANPYVDAYFLVLSDQGQVGGDHSF